MNSELKRRRRRRNQPPPTSSTRESVESPPMKNAALLEYCLREYSATIIQKAVRRSTILSHGFLIL